jgi:hypothetical protein
MQKPEAYGMGHEMGWSDALRFVAGTRADRRAVRRRYRKSEESYADFWLAYRDAFRDRAEGRADAIKAGTTPRTIRPSKVYHLLNHGA